MTWISDENGNRCSVERWGSEEKARAVLATNKDCSGCSDCSDCSRCFDCSDCSDCSRCSGCFDCSGCSRCSRCSGCFRCSDCSGCFDCSGCSRCSRCSDCSDCSRCSDCSDCSDCSRCFDCSGCFRCSDCSRCSGCFDCSGCSDCSDCSDCSRCFDLTDESPVEAQPSQLAIPIPVIEDLHKKLYAAVIATEESLNMENVHSCATTHCRAGWVVTLAGEAGAKLESRFGWDLAAMKIYDASCPGFEISPVRFYDSEKDALADMKRLAESS